LPAPLIRKRASAYFGSCGGCRFPACASDRFSWYPCYCLSLVAAFAAERLTKMQALATLIARPDLHSTSAPMTEPLCSYRDSRSNPSAAALPQRCQPLVMRIVPGFEI